MAKGLKEEAYGLVFGLNTFTALLVQTILTLIVADSVGLALLPDKQVRTIEQKRGMVLVKSKRNKTSGTDQVRTVSVFGCRPDKGGEVVKSSSLQTHEEKYNPKLGNYKLDELC